LQPAVSPNNMRIPVFAGPRIIDICDAISVRRYLEATNAEVVRKRKSGQIVQVNLSEHGDDSLLLSRFDDCHPTYLEHVGSHPVVMLKRLDPRTGQLLRWPSEDKPDVTPALSAVS